jgi:hypothetical protein
MQSTSAFLSTACAGCGETFHDDWVQCGSCLKLWHEDCSAWKRGGSFLYDRCKITAAHLVYIHTYVHICMYVCMYVCTLAETKIGRLVYANGRIGGTVAI